MRIGFIHIFIEQFGVPGSVLGVRVSGSLYSNGERGKLNM